MRNFLEFEKPIAELEGKIEELRHLSDGGDLNIAEEVTRLQGKVDRLLHQTYARLTPWQKVQVARHPERPHMSDYVGALIEDFTPLAGDRLFGEDQAVVGGLGRYHGYSVVVIGQEKGTDTDGRVQHNFGMAQPEGYRKARRLMELADRFGLPVLTLVDTPGAYPGIGVEERGQAEAIARCIETCLDIRVPLVSVIIGEGGSGGAIAIATGDRVLMLEHAVYSVISPEGCASILWRSAEQAEQAARRCGSRPRTWRSSKWSIPSSRSPWAARTATLSGSSPTWTWRSRRCSTSCATPRAAFSAPTGARSSWPWARRAWAEAKARFHADSETASQFAIATQIRKLPFGPATGLGSVRDDRR